VLCRHDAHGGDRWVVAQVPAHNRLVRRLADGEQRQVLVANVDTALLACGLDHDFNLRRIERLLAFVRMADVCAVVVLTKADLADDVEARTKQVRARLRPDEAVVAVNALDDHGRSALQPWLVAGHTLVLLGSSGVGKSTLTNLLTRHAGSGATQATGAVRASDSRGRHTTTVRSLHLTPSGACIIDTPGLRTLRLDADETALRSAFDDIESLAQQCRFRNCRHGTEPGCAVRSGLPAERIAHYDKLLREVRRDTMTQLDRREQLRQFKARGRAARAHIAAKGR
jgi:ribosome biogenesis GTPase